MTNFSIEKSIDGPVIGIDEVGRGPLAGPVVSCGCIFNTYDNQLSYNSIKDSKKLTTSKKQNYRVSSWICYCSRNRQNKYT